MTVIGAGNTSSQPPSLGNGSKKRRSSDFEDDDEGSEEYSSPTQHGLPSAAQSSGSGSRSRSRSGSDEERSSKKAMYLAPPKFTDLSSSPGPPSSPTVNLGLAQQNKRIKSRGMGMERAATLGAGLFPTTTATTTASSKTNPFAESPAPLTARPALSAVQSFNGVATSQANPGGARKTLPKRPALSIAGVAPGFGQRTASSTAALPPSRISTAFGSSNLVSAAAGGRRAFSAIVPKGSGSSAFLFGQKETNPTNQIVPVDSDDILDEVQHAAQEDDLDLEEDESSFDLSMDSFSNYHTGSTAPLQFNNTSSSQAGKASIGKGFPSTLLSSNSNSNATKTKNKNKARADMQALENSPVQRAQAARQENIGRFGNRHSAHARAGGMGNAMMMQASPLRMSTTSGGATAAGVLGGFGDSEADGKVLPCHKVREDGLMRITPHTVSFVFIIVKNRFLTTRLGSIGPRPRQRAVHIFHPLLHHRRLPLRLRAQRWTHPWFDQPQYQRGYRGHVPQQGSEPSSSQQER